MYCVDQDGEVKAAISGSVVSCRICPRRKTNPWQVTARRVEILQDELTQVLVDNQTVLSLRESVNR